MAVQAMPRAPSKQSLLGRGTDAGGGELGLVVDRPVGVDADHGVDVGRASETLAMSVEMVGRRDAGVVGG